ncbi:MAG TPA: inositol monophosphatase family protein [Thermoleophilaceae bacterium]
MTSDDGAPAAELRGLVRDLALALRERVVPMLGSHAARAHEEELAAGGDITFAIDAEAEELLASFLAERAPHVAFYSEDRGLVLPGGGEADTVLVVDPIDGTRPALAGFESCCVSVAAAPLRDDVSMGDVSVGCVVEIPSGIVFLAERGQGLVEAPPVRLSRNEELERMFWVYGFRGRPVRLYTELLGGLIEASSVGGGCFELGSATYDSTRVLTGQLDAYIEPGPRLIEDLPETRSEFERVGGGSVLNNTPYDLAAVVLCLEEGGAVVTDAGGGSLAAKPLLGAGPEHQMSVVACANPRLHALLIEELDAGMGRVAFSLAGAQETESR